MWTWKTFSFLAFKVGYINKSEVTLSPWTKKKKEKSYYLKRTNIDPKFVLELHKKAKNVQRVALLK